MNESLVHHGILGMKWGVRRYQNKDGSLTRLGEKRKAGESRVVEKGHELKRITVKPTDTEQPLNRKYFSTNEADNAKWREYLGSEYAKLNNAIYESTFEVMGDIHVASGKTMVDTATAIRDKNPKRFDEDAKKAYCVMRYKQKAPDDYDTLSEEAVSLMLANAPFEYGGSGKRIIKSLKNQGYGGVEDIHGRNTAESPLIIFDYSKDTRLIKEEINKEYFFKGG